MPAQFAFIAKLDETEYCKPWLTIKPAMGIIMQGMVRLDMQFKETILSASAMSLYVLDIFEPRKLFFVCNVCVKSNHFIPPYFSQKL